MGSGYHPDGSANGLATLDADGEVLQPANRVVDHGGGSNLRFKVIDIGDWNMDSTVSVNVAHGLTLARIRNVSALIRSDPATAFHDLARNDDHNGSGNHGISVDATYVALYREDGGFFDSSAFDSTSFNRGWITICYVEF